MRASVGHTWYEAETWSEVVVLIIMSLGIKTDHEGRRAAILAVNSGVTTVLGGHLIKPEGARE